MQLVNKNKTQYDRLWKAIVLICYATITFIVMWRHEAWRDEGQAWLIGMNLSIKDIFYQMRYEGHPALWSVILKGIGSIYPSFKGAQIFIWLLNCITVVLVLQIEKVSPYIKLAFIFSTPMLYTYTIIIRSYSLIPFLLVVATYAYNKKAIIWFGIVIAILANIHILMFGFCGIILLLLLIEAKNENKRKNIISAIIIFFGIAMVITQLIPSIYSNTSVIPMVFSHISLRELIIKAISQIGLVGINIFGISRTRFAVPVIGIMIILMLISLGKVSKKTSIIFFFSAAYFFLILVFIYPLTGAQYYMANQPKVDLLLLVYFYCLVTVLNSTKINEAKKKKISTIVFCIVFIGTIPYGITNMSKDYTNAISGGKEVAKIIEVEVGENDVVIINSDATAASILAYLPRRAFWFPPQNKYITFCTWDNTIKQHSYGDLENIITKLEANSTIDTMFFLETINMGFFQLDNSVESILIYDGDEPIMVDEQFNLYKINCK